MISKDYFINHHPEILQKHYIGQPLYATIAVFEALTVAYPNIVLTYYSAMRILYPLDRPWGVKTNHSPFSELTFRRKLLTKKKSLSYFAKNPNFIIDDSHKPTPIGVSLNVTYGFVEAGHEPMW